jgi:hypothetical protein
MPLMRWVNLAMRRRARACYPMGDAANGNGSFPWGPNDLGTFWLCSMVMGRILGVENCAAMETEARARIAASVALARVTGYPESLTNFPAFIWS